MAAPQGSARAGLRDAAPARRANPQREHAQCDPSAERFDAIDAAPLETVSHDALEALVGWIDDVLGLKLATSTPDITEEQKQLILERERAREASDWSTSDRIRDELAKQDIVLRDTNRRTVWSRL